MLVARVSRLGALRPLTVHRAYTSATPRLVGQPTGVAVPSVRLAHSRQRPLTSALVGFLSGAALAAAAGLYWIRHEYTQASTSVLQSSERLTDMANHVRDVI